MAGKGATSTTTYPDPIYPASYGFEEAFWQQIAPKLLTSPMPGYTGSIDPGLSPTMQRLLTAGQAQALSPAPQVAGQADGVLGRYLNQGIPGGLDFGPGRERLQDFMFPSYSPNQGPSGLGQPGPPRPTPGGPQHGTFAPRFLGGIGDWLGDHAVPTTPNYGPGTPPAGVEDGFNDGYGGGLNGQPDHGDPTTPDYGGPGGGGQVIPGGPRNPDSGFPGTGLTPTPGKPAIPNLGPWAGPPQAPRVPYAPWFVGLDPGNPMPWMQPGGNYVAKPPGAPGGGVPGPGGGPPGGGRAPDPRGTDAWLGRWRGINKGKSWEEVVFDNWTRGFGGKEWKNYTPPAQLVEEYRKRGLGVTFGSNPAQGALRPGQPPSGPGGQGPPPVTPPPPPGSPPPKVVSPRRPGRTASFSTTAPGQSPSAQNPVMVQELLRRQSGQVPGFAMGGVVTQPTLAVVGEAGPEAVVPMGRRPSGRVKGGNNDFPMMFQGGAPPSTFSSRPTQRPGGFMTSWGQGSRQPGTMSATRPAAAPGGLVGSWTGGGQASNQSTASGFRPATASLPPGGSWSSLGQRPAPGGQPTWTQPNQVGSTGFSALDQRSALSPMDSFRAAAPVFEQNMRDRISDAIGQTGLDGTRFSSYTADAAAREGGRAANEQNQYLAQLVAQQNARDQDYAWRGTELSTNLGYQQNENALDRALRAQQQQFSQGLEGRRFGLDAQGQLFDMARYEQDRQDRMAMIPYQQWQQDRLGYLPMLMGMFGNGGPSYGPGQTTSSGGSPGALDYAALIASFL